jgi:hypothetical protein
MTFKQAISKHLTNIFETNELEENSVISILETTATDGKNYKTSYYSLDAIIAVGVCFPSCRICILVKALLVFGEF